MQICSRPERSISECQACSITNQDTVCKKRHWILSRSKATCRNLFGDILLALLTSSGHSVLHHVNFRRPTMYSDFVSQLVGRVDKFPSNNFFSRFMYLWVSEVSICMFTLTMLLFRESSQIPYLHCALYLPSSCLFPITLVFVHWPFALKN